jgi:hypothetical protein
MRTTVFVVRRGCKILAAHVALVVLAGACVSAGGGNFPTDAVARPATGTPAAFTFTVPHSPNSCRSPALNPQDGTRLVLARSVGERGDYEVPAGQYGVSAREYLRLDCATGRVIGVVPR